MPSTRVDLKYGHWEAPEALLTSLCPVLGFTEHTEIQDSDINRSNMSKISDNWGNSEVKNSTWISCSPPTGGISPWPGVLPPASCPGNIRATQCRFGQHSL